jgi:hypothetical protein
VLGDARRSRAHACTAEVVLKNSWSYSIMVGSGLSHAARTPPYDFGNWMLPLIGH